MACSLCGVPGFGRSCSAHTGTDSQTYDEQRSKQVRAASMTSKDVLDKLYSTPYCKETIEDLISKSKLKGTFEDEIINITKNLADAIFDVGESAFMGRELETDTEELEALTMVMQHHHSPHHYYIVPTSWNVLLFKQPKGAQQW